MDSINMTNKLTTIKPIADSNSFVTDTKPNHRKDFIEIGDTKQPDKCYPQAKLIQWDNETNFSLRLAEEVTGSSAELKDGSFIWKSSDKTTEAHIYELDIDEDGGLEFEVILHQKPKSNVVNFTLQSKGLSFYYQPELTEKEIEDGDNRPENVVGSYAVYHSTNKNHYKKRGHKNYKTGKSFHIYRPFAVDAQDSTTWCILNIENDDLTITVPQEFIDNAIYPIKIDPTIGYTTAGSSYTTGSPFFDYAFVNKDTVSEGGTINDLYVYTYKSTGAIYYFKGCIWDVSKDVISNGVSNVGEYVDDNWVNVSFSTDPTFTSGTYYVGVVDDSNTVCGVYYDTGSSGDGGYHDDNDYSSPDSLGSLSYDNRKYSVYVNYIPEGYTVTVIKFTNATDAGSYWTNDSNAADDDWDTYAYRDVPASSGEETSYTLTLDANDVNTAITEDIGDIDSVYLEYDVGIPSPPSSDFLYIHTTPIYNGSSGDKITYGKAGYYPSTIIGSHNPTIDITDDTNSPGDGNWTKSDIETIDVKFHGENEDNNFDKEIDVYEACLYVVWKGVAQERSYKLHYYKDGIFDIPLWDANNFSNAVGVYYNSETSYAELVATSDPSASDLRARVGGVTYSFVLGGDSTSTPPVTSAFAEAFIHEDTASATNRSNTSEADVALTGAADLEQGDWSGQWTAPDLTLPETNLYLSGYCDFLRQSGTLRSGALCQLEVNGTKSGIYGVSTWGYNRNSGGADESTRHMVSFLSGTLNDVYTIREATQLNSSDRVGDYNRTSGDPRGMWSLNLKGASDYLVASSSTTDNASGVIGNSPRPIDLGTPSSLTSGSWKTVTFSSTDGSSGSTITRSTNTFTVAANSVVLCHFVGQFWGAGPRKAVLVRMDIDGSPYAYTSCYMRNASMDGATCSITMPVITGGSSVDVTFSFVDQAETTTELHMDMRYKAVSFIDFTGQDIVLLEQGTTDITGIDGATPDTVSWPVADEIQVDSSFDHPTGNLTRIENNAGEEITVLAGFCFLADRSVATSGTRQFIAGQLVKTGTDVDYCIAGETSRGSQGDDDCFIAGASYCAPVVLGTSDYLELDIKDIAQNTGGCMINCSDGSALYMWAIRIDN
jgi:hypothetical protein